MGLQEPEGPGEVRSTETGSGAQVGTGSWCLKGPGGQFGVAGNFQGGWMAERLRDSVNALDADEQNT